MDLDEFRMGGICSSCYLESIAPELMPGAFEIGGWKQFPNLFRRGHP
jgi:hypothetical protein